MQCKTSRQADSQHQRNYDRVANSSCIDVLFNLLSVACRLQRVIATLSMSSSWTRTRSFSMWTAIKLDKY